MGSRRFDIIRDEASCVVEDERFLLLVFNDENAENPAMLDYHISEIYGFGHANKSRFTKHDYDDIEEAIEDIGKDKIIYLTELYMYQHSGIAVSVTPFSCKWDSGVAGYVIVTEDRFKECFGRDFTESKEDFDAIKENVKAEVEEVSNYLNGEVYQYILFEKVSDSGDYKGCDYIDSRRDLWNEKDSGCEFYGSDHKKNGVLESIKTAMTEDAADFIKLLEERL